MQNTPSVVFIRESEQQMSSSGCCGRLSGDFRHESGGRPVFAERRAIMERMGPLYRRIRERFDSGVEINVVDPRNLPSLLYLLVRDFRRYAVPPAEAFRTLFRLPVSGLLVNGRLLSRNGWPCEEEVVEILDVLLAAPPGRIAETSFPETSS